MKLLDSQERLTVQVHPDEARAKRLFHSPFGKTECWHVLGVRDDLKEPACIYLGFQPGITREAWEYVFEHQDTTRMLSMLNQMPVRKGDTYLVRTGTPHAIGAGCLILEAQEPTDYTIRTERTTPSGFSVDDYMCHQGLGFKLMFECFDYIGMDPEQVRDKYFIQPQRISDNPAREVIVGYDRTPCFQLERIEMTKATQWDVQDTFSCLFITEGTGRLRSGEMEMSVAAGDQFFLPAGCAPLVIIPRAPGHIVTLAGKGPQIL